MKVACPVCGESPCSKHKLEIIGTYDSKEQAEAVCNAARQMDGTGRYEYKVIDIGEDN